MPVNFYSLFLDLARIHANSEPIRRVLDSLSDAVTAARKTVDHAQANFAAEHYEALYEDESDVLESMVGTASVAAQTQITGVISTLKRLHNYAARHEVALTTITGSKDAIMQLASSPLTGTTFTRIQVINAFANYYKHGDEWKTPWSNLNALSQATAEIVEAAGGTENSSGNLRTGLKALGIVFDLLDCLHEEISKWAEALVAIYKSELKAIGLL